MSWPQACDGARARMVRDDGFMLVEILVSAILLVTVSLATLQLIDQSDKVAGDDQGRAVAANLAQAQLEYLRALSPDQIPSDENREVVEGGNKYVVRTNSRWVSDGQTTVDCSKPSGGLDYLQVSVSSDWPGRKSTSPPVKFSTAITPVASSQATAGSLVVRLNGAAVNGQPSQPTANVRVEIAGPENDSEVTNSAGCVVFPMIAWGQYTVKLNKPGFVDSKNVSDVANTVMVSRGQTTKLQLDYDLGGYTGSPVDPPTYPLVFVTKPVGASNSQRTAVSAMSLVRGTTSTRLQKATPTATWDLSKTPLWPSDTPYHLYAGECDSNGRMNPSDITSVSIGRGTTNRVPSVTVPALDVEVYTKSGSWWNPKTTYVDADVVFTQNSCATDPIRKRTRSSDGRLDDPGFPYTRSGDNAELCVSYNNRKRVFSDFANNQFNPTSTFKVDMSSGTSWGSC